MISIIQATLNDSNLLTNLGKTTFLEAHGKSASEKNINTYISKFNYENGSLNICEFVASKGDSDFEKGRYIVNVFNAKDLVSSSDFTLK